jgi:hypothetical protein
MVGSRVALERSSPIGKAVPHLLDGQAFSLAEVELGQTWIDLHRQRHVPDRDRRVSRARVSELDHTSAKPA